MRATSWCDDTEDEAKAIKTTRASRRARDFAALAKEKIEGPGPQADGGDLGYFTKDQMVPEFAEVAFKLDKGQVSDPVKTQFGWHVIKVEDKRKSSRCRHSTRSRTSSRPMWCARRRPTTSPSCAQSAKIERLDKPRRGQTGGQRSRPRRRSSDRSAVDLVIAGLRAMPARLRSQPLFRPSASLCPAAARRARRGCPAPAGHDNEGLP